MPKQGDVHVEVEGSGRPLRSAHKTQLEASKAGRDIARKNKSELLIHGRNGRVGDRSAYGRDPRRTKG